MSDSKYTPGATATYNGIMEKRRGQEVKIGNTASGLVSCTFPDGKIIGCAPSSLRMV